jgi:hypothetical protein
VTAVAARPVEPPARPRRSRPAIAAALALAALYLPALFLGYGTDIDVANVLRAGDSALTGDYEISRGPGAVVHETGTALLDAVGGSVLVNLVSLAFAALAVWSIQQILRDDGARWPGWIALLLATNPWFWIAATSLGDFVWALGLSLAAVHAARREHRLAAGLLFGLAIGCRASSVLLAAAWLLAERTGRPDQRPPWSATLRTAAVLGLVGALCFVPPWLSSDRTLDFLEGQLEFVGVGIHLGRWAVKNAAVIGVPAALVLLVGVRRLLGALARWTASPVVRFSVFAIVAMELLFFRLPFKPLHLLPVVAAGVLLAGASPLVTKRWLLALAAAQVLGAFVGTTIAEPDVPHAARSGQVRLGLIEGTLLNEVRCRLDDRERGPWPDPTDPAEFDAAMARAFDSFDCQIGTWRADAR